MPWQLWSQINLNCENNLDLRSFPNKKRVIVLSQPHRTENCGQGDSGGQGKLPPHSPEAFGLVNEMVKKACLKTIRVKDSGVLEL